MLYMIGERVTLVYPDHETDGIEGQVIGYHLAGTSAETHVVLWFDGIESMEPDFSLRLLPSDEECEIPL